MNDDVIERYRIKLGCSRDISEYLCTGTAFNRTALKFDAFMLHASAIRFNGKAYLFSGQSGAGKSTHTGLWKKHLGNRVAYINDDKPLLRRSGKYFSACGTPWSGKTDLNENIKAPAAAVCFLEKRERPFIARLNAGDAYEKLNAQTSHPYDETQAGILRDLLIEFSREVPAYILECDTSEASFLLAFDALTDRTPKNPKLNFYGTDTLEDTAEPYTEEEQSKK